MHASSCQQHPPRRVACRARAWRPQCQTACPCMSHGPLAWNCRAPAPCRGWWVQPWGGTRKALPGGGRMRGVRQLHFLLLPPAHSAVPTDSGCRRLNTPPSSASCVLRPFHILRQLGEQVGGGMFSRRRWRQQRRRRRRRLSGTLHSLHLVCTSLAPQLSRCPPQQRLPRLVAARRWGTTAGARGCCLCKAGAPWRDFQIAEKRLGRAIEGHSHQSNADIAPPS